MVAADAAADQSALASLELLTNADTIFLQITTAFLGDLAVIIYRMRRWSRLVSVVLIALKHLVIAPRFEPEFVPASAPLFLTDRGN